MAGQVLDLLLPTITIIGFLLAVWQFIRAERLKRRQRDYDWSRFQDATATIVQQIRRDSFVPELILAMSERGAIIAHLVMRGLGLEIPIITAPYDHCRTSSFKLDGHLRIGNGFAMLVPEALRDFQTKRILLTDDFANSGDTLAATRTTLIDTLGFNRSLVRSACIATSEVAKRQGRSPDYCERVVSEIHFRFPWGPTV